MIGNYYDNFFEEDAPEPIPAEVLDALNKQLPPQLMYYQSDDGCVLGPVPGEAMKDMSMTTEMELSEELRERLKSIPKELWNEYFYRTQQRVKVKRARMNFGGAEVDLQDMVGNPLLEKEGAYTFELAPEPFPPAKKELFETADGTKVSILFRRKPYASMNEIMLANEDFPALNLEWFYHETDETLSMKIAINPRKAESVADACTALKIFLGFHDGTLKIAGSKLPQKMKTDDASYESSKDALAFWENARKLEERLRVTFIPGAEFPQEDENFFWELCFCMLENKPLFSKHPFFEFTASGVDLYGNSKEQIMNKPGVSFLFMETPKECTLLGAGFTIYSVCHMSGFMITDIIPTDDTELGGSGDATIVIADSSEEPWRLRRQYFPTQEEAVQEYRRLHEEEHSEHI